MANPRKSTKRPKRPHFYMQAKIYKEGDPGRPAISSVNCHKPKISQSVCHYLQPHIEETKSYAKDSTDFIKKVSTTDKVPPDNILVTSDVYPLYPNVFNNEDLETVEKTLTKKSSINSNYHLTAQTFYK